MKPGAVVSLGEMRSPAKPKPAARRRRSDAERSIAAILDGAAELLAENPQASMVEVAEHAGVTRQTVYAHFPSRESLMDAVRDRAVDEAGAAIAEARIDEGTAMEALDRLIGAGWQTLARHSHLLNEARPLENEAFLELHEPVMKPLGDLVRRGQASGEFDQGPPVSWLLASFIGLSHSAAGELNAGRMTEDEARAELHRAVLRVFEAHGN